MPLTDRLKDALSDIANEIKGALGLGDKALQPIPVKAKGRRPIGQHPRR